MDVPLPLGLALFEDPVVGEVPGVAELAAGSPVVEPRPLGAPPCAFAYVPEAISVTARTMITDLMNAPLFNESKLGREHGGSSNSRRSM